MVVSGDGSLFLLMGSTISGPFPLLSALRLVVFVVRSRRIDRMSAGRIVGTFLLGFLVFGRAELSTLRETYDDFVSTTSLVRKRLDNGPKPRMVYKINSSRMKPAAEPMTTPTMAPVEREL